MDRMCKNLECKKEFKPKRKDQNFCSSRCRIKFFSLARKIGVKILEQEAKTKSARNFKVQGIGND